MSDIFHALADPHRRTIVDRLHAGPATVSELAAIVPVARPGVSRHLRVLREAGLVAVTSSAQFRHYRLEPEPLAQLDDWLATYRDLWTQRLDALHTEVARGTRSATAHDPTQEES
jgi:DNA-binding transcriptional ArsR family regulator